MPAHSDPAFLSVALTPTAADTVGLAHHMHLSKTTLQRLPRTRRKAKQVLLNHAAHPNPPKKVPIAVAAAVVDAAAGEAEVAAAHATREAFHTAASRV